MLVLEVCYKQQKTFHTLYLLTMQEKYMPLWEGMISHLFGRERRRIIAVPFGPKYLLNAETYYENLKERPKRTHEYTHSHTRTETHTYYKFILCIMYLE